MQIWYCLHKFSSRLQGIPLAIVDHQRERELVCETGDWQVVGTQAKQQAFSSRWRLMS